MVATNAQSISTAEETFTSLLDAGAVSIYRPQPLVNRCKCGQQISDTRIACRACALAALRESQATA